MSKISFLLLFVFLTIQVESTVVKSPRDINDQIREELDQLSSIVQGTILAAQNQLSNLEFEFLNNGNNIINTGAISIQQEKETIDEEINTLKDLANAAEADISACTDIRQEILERLPAEFNNQLRTCVFDFNKQEAAMVADAKYIIDVAINKVHRLEFLVQQCRGDLLCLSPILTEIELDKVRLPQGINTEVNAVDSLLTMLSVSVQQCSDTAVTQYVANALSLLQDITDCVNRILG